MTRATPDDRYDAALTLSAGAGDGRDGDFARALTVVPASLVKGLEFDSVVLVAPDEIAADGPHGRRSLYVAMTRCTQQLHIVSCAALLAGLDHLAGPNEAAVPVLAARQPMPGETDGPAEGSTSEELMALLGAADRWLVEQVVRRLVGAEAPR